MDERDLDILHKCLLVNLGGYFEVYEYSTLDPNPSIFQQIWKFISLGIYVPTKRYLAIIWHINGYTVMDSYPESYYETIDTLEEMGKFVEKVVDKLKERYKNRPKNTGDK